MRRRAAFGLAAAALGAALATALGAALAWRQADEPARALVHHRLADLALAARRAPAPDTLLLGSSSIVRMPPGRPACGAVLNRGMGSASLADIARYLDRAPEAVRAGRVVVYAGERDVAAGADVAAIDAAYAALLERLSAWGPADGVHVLALKPGPRRRALWPTFERVNGRLRERAAADPGIHFHAVPHAAWHPPADARPAGGDAFVADGVHLAPRGYELFLNGLESQCRNR